MPGLGLPRWLLAPSRAVTDLLGLRVTPGPSGLSLSDVHGPAVISRQWRARPVHDGSYLPHVHAVTGADLLIRPDVVDALVDIAGGGEADVVVTMSQSQTGSS